MKLSLVGDQARRVAQPGEARHRRRRPLGPLGYNFSQHSPTTRPSVERTAEKAFMLSRRRHRGVKRGLNGGARSPLVPLWFVGFLSLLTRGSQPLVRGFLQGSKPGRGSARATRAPTGCPAPPLQGYLAHKKPPPPLGPPSGPTHSPTVGS